MQLKFSVTRFKWENPRVFCYLPETGPRVMSGQPWNKKGPPSSILLPRLLGNNPKGVTLHAVSRVSAALLQKKKSKAASKTPYLQWWPYCSQLQNKGNIMTACCYCELGLKGRKIFREGNGGNETERMWTFLQQVCRWVPSEFTAAF